MTALEPNKSKRYGWLLALVFALSLIPQLTRSYVPNTWLGGDGGFYLNIQKSLTRYNSLNQGRLHPHSWYNQRADNVNDAFSNIALGSDGEWWPKHSYLMPIVALPFYWLFGVLGTLLFNLLATVGSIVLCYHVARRFASDNAAITATLLVAFAGPFAAHSYNFSNDNFYTVLILSGLLATLHDKEKGAGLLLGLAIWAKVTNLLFAPLFLAIMLTRTKSLERWKHFLLFAAIPLALFGLANWYMFGAPWISSYQRVLVVENGLISLASHSALFEVPFWLGLEDLLVSRHHGLLTVYPLFWIGLLGLGPLIRGHRTIGLTLVFVLLGVIAFFAPFEYYQERFLLPWFALVVIPMALFIQQLYAQVQEFTISSKAARAGVAVGVLLLVLSRLAYVWAPLSQDRLSNHLEDARVFLGNVRCDYFNNMRWAWECTQFDEKESEFVGRNANQEHPFNEGVAREYIFAGSHQSGAPRRLVFPAIELDSQLTIRYGLDQKSVAPHNTHLRIHVGGQELYDTIITESGVLLETALDTSVFMGEKRDVVITISNRGNGGARLLVDGWLDSPSS